MIDPSAKIAPTALISDEAQIGPDVIIKDHVIIEGPVKVGQGCIIEPFCVLRGPTTLGKRNHIYQFCSIGEGCQDLKYKGEPTELIVGDDNTMREHCTMHRGTVQGMGKTVVGNRNLFMVNVHVAHDCMVGDDCIFSNNATLAGHVVIGNHVIFGGLSAIHQFGRVGSYAFIGGMAALNMDVPPYVMAAGHYAKAHGINKVGLSRRGFTDEQIGAIRKAYMIIYHKHLTVEEAIAQIEPMCQEFECLKPLVGFLKENGRGIVR